MQKLALKPGKKLPLKLRHGICRKNWPLGVVGRKIYRNSSPIVEGNTRVFCRFLQIFPSTSPVHCVFVHFLGLSSTACLQDQACTESLALQHMLGSSMIASGSSDAPSWDTGYPPKTGGSDGFALKLRPVSWVHPRRIPNDICGGGGAALGFSQHQPVRG